MQEWTLKVSVELQALVAVADLTRQLWLCSISQQQQQTQQIFANCFCVCVCVSRWVWCLLAQHSTAVKLVAKLQVTINFVFVLGRACSKSSVEHAMAQR